MTSEIAAALLTVQKNLPRVVKSQQAHHSKYADLATITEAVFPVLADAGLVWTCHPLMAGDDRLVMRWQLVHAASGDTWTGDYPIPASSPQTIGGALTYARRYAMCSVIGLVADEDDDGNVVEQETAKRQQDGQRARNRGQKPAEPFEPAFAADAPGSKSDLQRTKIMQAMGRMPREVRLTALADVIGREVGSVNDLSFNEAQKVLKRIEDDRRHATTAAGSGDE